VPNNVAIGCNEEYYTDSIMDSMNKENIGNRFLENVNIF
jgi:hypothetical protein